jgi:hypothetical protein
MADFAGSYTNVMPTISQNTSVILKFRNQYANGATSVNLPLKIGTRYIINSLITNGKKVEIGFGLVEGTITEKLFTYEQSSGPLDLSNFFANAPFSIYKAPSASFEYLIVTSDAEVTIAYCEYKG